MTHKWSSLDRMGGTSKSIPCLRGIQEQPVGEALLCSFKREIKLAPNDSLVFRSLKPAGEFMQKLIIQHFI